jgi:hypothetical protein
VSKSFSWSKVTRTRPISMGCVCLTKQHFMCGTVDRDVTMPVMLLNMNVIHRRSMCALTNKEFIGPFCLEEPTVTSDTFLLYVMPQRQKFSCQMVNYPNSPVVFVPFRTGSFLTLTRKRGPIPWAPRSTGVVPLWVYNRNCLY